MTRFSQDRQIQSWGRVFGGRHQLATPVHRCDLHDVFEAACKQDLPVLGFGLGRSYGDSNLNPDGLLLDGRALDRFIEFDRATGSLTAEAGVSLDEILRISVPAGFFLPTTPGTRFVTIAGAVANDVHGKNHHGAGCFGNAVRRIGLFRSREGAMTLSREENAELFAATIGGLGLTGLISWVEVQLVPIASAYIEESRTAFANVNAFFDLASDAGTRFEHSVAWVDCTARGDSLGRGVFFGGNWSDRGGLTVHRDAGPTLPLDLPASSLNPLTLGMFNALYRAHSSMRPKASLVHYAPFFYPLDRIRGWNRLYGPKGFFQYQSVVPMARARTATREMLDVISASGQGSMLAVLKTFGERRSPGLLSFPMEGVTLALDFKNSGVRTMQVFDALDAIVLRHGGRLYPAKDGRMSGETFRAGYPDWERLEGLRDPLISSAFWRRVMAE
ncbi:FAD-binding oxidoreductase [Maricaulis sp.]|uniref:FAD-binding oxidoreductase n=1 Tax=Maricaulis sp. TaxID=1486257 RepID=UPI003A938EE5